MLVFIGLGIEQSPSLSAIDELKTCDVIYYERYTSPVLARKRNSPWEILSLGADKVTKEVKREFIEDGRRILREAKTKKIALVSSGDPLVATTHQELRTRAIQEGVETKVVHGSSILCAIGGEFGLHSYNFGRVVTMTEEPMQHTAYDTIYQNILRGLHTTILLQWDESRDFFLSPSAATRALENAELDMKYGIIRSKTLVLIGSRLGDSDAMLHAYLLGDLPKAQLGDPPHVMIIPGKLHFTEREALSAVLGKESSWFTNNTEGVQKLSKSMVDRYSKKTLEALQRAREAAKKTLSGAAPRAKYDEIFENVECYTQDAVRFMNEGREELAVLSIGYAEGLLDSLRFGGLLEFEW